MTSTPTVQGGDKATGTTQYFVVLTLEKPQGPGRVEQGTFTTTVDVAPGSGVTRAQLLSELKQRIPERMRDGAVLFFSVEPNRLAA